MAVVLEENKKTFSWGKFAGIMVLVVVLGLAVYYLFFAPTPAFEIVVPSPLQSAQQISDLEIDPAVVVNGAAFKSLKNHSPVPEVGIIGRVNPFVPF
jgi:hypothetical protein